MQLPSASSDLLMLAPSLSLAPLFVVTVALSDPARSIRDILALVTCALRPAVRAFWCTNTYDVMMIHDYYVMVTIYYSHWLKWPGHSAHNFIM
jgi:hypothetical protein